MREIKFRAWNVDGELKDISGKMFYFDLYDIDAPGMLNVGSEEWGWIGDDTILMQYTGLKDRQGREIFEGDIVREYGEFARDDPAYGIYEPCYRIEYSIDHNRAYYAGYRLDDPTPETVMELLGPIEVIGNIYEHPELLKQ